MVDVTELNDADFAKVVLARSSKEPVVVDFWAPWCGPCKMLGPVLEEACSELELPLVKVNVDKNTEIASGWGVSGIPAVKVFEEKRVTTEFVGALPKPRILAELSEVVKS